MTKIKETSTHFENKKSLASECAEIYAANLIGGQWTLIICCHLSEGILRFGELKKRIPNITERMLTLQLRKLEEDRLVQRTVYAEVPLRVEYTLTAIGQQLGPIIKELGAWGILHKKTMQAENNITEEHAFCIHEACNVSPGTMQPAIRIAPGL